MTDDFDTIRSYLPVEGHPQGVEEAQCPYCALRRIEADVQREHDCVERWSLRAEQAEAELADARFWHWLWTETALMPKDEKWLAHMREKWEREAHDD